MNSDNLGGLALVGISGQSLGSVPFKTAIIARREATKADVGQTALAINLVAFNSSFAKDAPHKPIMQR